jgi:hypothetical protein
MGTQQNMAKVCFEFRRELKILQKMGLVSEKHIEISGNSNRIRSILTKLRIKGESNDDRRCSSLGCSWLKIKG